MRYELLKSEFDRVVAVNCKVDGDSLHVGFMFIDIKTPSEVTLISSKGETVRVKLPDEFSMQNHAKISLEGDVEVDSG